MSWLIPDDWQFGYRGFWRDLFWAVAGPGIYLFWWAAQWTTTLLGILSRHPHNRVRIVEAVDDWQPVRCQRCGWAGCAKALTRRLVRHVPGPDDFAWEWECPRCWDRIWL
jgi:hypothetical protein